MPDRSAAAAAAPAASPDGAGLGRPAARTVLLEVLLLGGATLLLYRGDLPPFVAEAAYDPMRATLLLLPALLAAWIWRRRTDLAASVHPARVAGALLWGLGLLAHAASAWPFPVFQFRVWAMVPMLAGIVLWAGGWRVLRECVPMLGVVFVSLPIGARVFGQLTGRIEGLVLQLAAAILDRLPGHSAGLESIDLVIDTAGGSAVVGLGAPHRALGGLLPFIALGLVIMFARRHSLAAMVLGLGAVPVLAVSACLVRLLAWAVLAVRTGDPVADTPRLVGTLAAFAWLWIATAAVGWILGLLLPDRAAPSPAVAEESPA
jgi:hypothetical protein